MGVTVHILSRAVGESVNEQYCHKNNEWCGMSHHVKRLQKNIRGLDIIILILRAHDLQKTDI